MRKNDDLSLVVDQLKRAATADQAERIDRLIERYVTDTSYSTALAAAHIGAVFGELLDVSSWDAVRVWATSRRSQAVIAGRGDELGFRAHVPAAIDGFTVLQVSHFRAGNEREYARALAVTQRGGSDFCTHWVVHQDNRDRWFLWEGHYDISTRQAAELDVLARSYLSPLVATVTIFSNDKTSVDAPKGVQITVVYELADGDERCTCGVPIFRDEHDRWAHRDGTADDHEPAP